MRHSWHLDPRHEADLAEPALIRLARCSHVYIQGASRPAQRWRPRRRAPPPTCIYGVLQRRSLLGQLVQRYDRNRCALAALRGSGHKPSFEFARWGVYTRFRDEPSLCNTTTPPRKRAWPLLAFRVDVLSSPRLQRLIAFCATFAASWLRTGVPAEPLHFSRRGVKLRTRRVRHGDGQRLALNGRRWERVAGPSKRWLVV